MNTAIDDASAAGKVAALVALTPESGGLYRVDAVDNETLPNPLPASGVATFVPATPMMVSDGDVLGFDIQFTGNTTNPGLNCLSVTLAATGTIIVGISETPGEVLSGIGGPLAVPVAATLLATEDSAVTTTVRPSAGAAGDSVLLASTVLDSGPASNPLTFTDSVPAGLTIAAAASPRGPCTTLGQVVTCTLSGLTAGQSAPVDIVVTGHSGTYTNSVTVAQPAAATDPATSNNTARAKITAYPATNRCIVTSLAKMQLNAGEKLLTTPRLQGRSGDQELQRQRGQRRRDQDTARDRHLRRR